MKKRIGKQPSLVILIFERLLLIGKIKERTEREQKNGNREPRTIDCEKANRLVVSSYCFFFRLFVMF